MGNTTGKLAARKYVAEVRYQPKLGFYGQMDAVGLDLADDFADWERSPLTLELRDKRRQRRLYLSSRRMFFEQDNGSDLHSSTDQATKFLGKSIHSLDVQEFQRVGNRFWFAEDLGKTFEAIVELLADRMFAAAGPLHSKIFDTTKIDLAYVTYFRNDAGWNYNVRVGPMRRDEWFEKVLHEPSIFDTEGPDKKGVTLEEYRESLSEQFVHVDIDCFKENVNKADLNTLLIEWRRFVEERTQQLMDYLKESIDGSVR
jgi:hypothetical protein